jgi:ABC-type nitrate/sulfonate/bicarbonate transport system permease component
MARVENEQGFISPLWKRRLLRSSSVILLAVVWEWGARMHFVSDFLLPSLSSVLERLWDDVISGDVPVALGLTMVRTFVGFSMAAVVGVIVGVTIARINLVRWFFDPIVSVGNPLPKIAFLPIFILWFGVFDWSKIAMVAFSSVFPVVVATWAATENVDKYIVWSAESLGVGRRALLWQIILPSAMPGVFTGLQIALPISLIVVIICEMTMGGEGLGGSMMTSMRFADSPGVFSGIVAIAIVGSVLVKLMEIVRQRLLVWHAESAH